MNKTKRSWQFLVSRVLIAAGLVMILTAVIYEAANYPWQLLFTPKEDWREESFLPDPPPPVFANDAVPYDPALHDELPGSVSPAGTSDATPAATELLPGGDSLLEGIAKPKPSIKYERIGILKIPKLGLSHNIFEGAGRGQLSLGIGHVLNTPRPGEEGNIALAGHRQSVVMHPFRHLDKMALGDIIFLKADGHVYEYETTSVLIVEPQDNTVLQAVDGTSHAITLITCHPLFSLSQRLVVQGRLIAIDGQTFALPAPQTTLIPDLPPVSPPPDSTQSGEDSETQEDPPQIPVISLENPDDLLQESADISP